MSGFWDVTIMFRVPTSEIEKLTIAEWRERLRNEIGDEEIDDIETYADVAIALAYNYIAAGSFVTGYEDMEATSERTVEGES